MRTTCAGCSRLLFILDDGHALPEAEAEVVEGLVLLEEIQPVPAAQPVAATPRLRGEVPVTPVAPIMPITPVTPDLQYILMQTMQQQMFQLQQQLQMQQQQQMMTFQRPPQSLLGRSGASRSITFPSSSSASSSSASSSSASPVPLLHSITEEGEEDLKRMESDGEF